MSGRKKLVSLCKNNKQLTITPKIW